MTYGGGTLIFEVIVRTEPEALGFIELSYEDVLRIVIDQLLSDEQLPLTIRKRSCSSLQEHTISVETCHMIRELVGVKEFRENHEEESLQCYRKKLDTAVNNWYLRGRLSLSDDELVKPVGSCYTY